MFEGDDEENYQYEESSDRVQVPISQEAQSRGGSEQKPKNLRSLLTKIRGNKPAVNAMDTKTPLNSSSDDDISNNSYTFGDPKLSKFPRKIRTGANLSKLNNELLENNSIEEIPESDMSDSQNEEAQYIKPTKVKSYKLIREKQENPFEKINQLIHHCEAERNQGSMPDIEAEKAKLLRMCEETEAIKRQNERNISIFEMDPERTDLTNKSKEVFPQVKLDRAVKAYKRSAADVILNDPLTVRPLPLIELVLDYLFEDIADADSVYKGAKNIFASEPTTGDVFIFIFDRTRAIRQELTIINEPTNRITIQAYEKIARFHCLTANEGLDIEGINHKLNSDQLTSTLTSLRESYNLVNETLKNQPEGRRLSDEEVFQSPNEAEFRSYMIMTQIKDLLEVNETVKTLSPNV